MLTMNKARIPVARSGRRLLVTLAVSGPIIFLLIALLS
jgi:hypothetical protein